MIEIHNDSEQRFLYLSRQQQEELMHLIAENKSTWAIVERFPMYKKLEVALLRQNFQRLFLIYSQVVLGECEDKIENTLRLISKSA